MKVEMNFRAIWKAVICGAVKLYCAILRGVSKTSF